jgi:L,D-peptidoglycan transpeptidase YkuD (ErfK/YbiS/YcfS/YnhG family)
LVEFIYQNGFLTGPGLKFPAACGAAGVTTHKTEGDQATPAGALKLLRILYRADREKPPATAVPIEPIGPNDAWCDDPNHLAYNSHVQIPHPARHEQLHRSDNLYDIIGVLNWNIAPTIPNRGSAIFLHIATGTFSPTQGCIALAPPHLRQCLAAGLSSITVK